MTDDALDHLEELVSNCHGHRTAVAVQLLREGEEERARTAQAQADAFYRVLTMMEQIRGGELDQDVENSYGELSRAVQTVDAEVSEESEFRPGLE